MPTMVMARVVLHMSYMLKQSHLHWITKEWDYTPGMGLYPKVC